MCKYGVCHIRHLDKITAVCMHALRDVTSSYYVPYWQVPVGGFALKATIHVPRKHLPAPMRQSMANMGSMKAITEAAGCLHAVGKLNAW